MSEDAPSFPAMTFTFSREELEAYHRLVRKRQANVGQAYYTWTGPLLPLAAITLAVAAAAKLGIIERSDIEPMFYFAILAYYAGFYINHTIIQRMGRTYADKIYQADPSYTGSRSVRLGASGIEFETAHTTSSIKYAAITEFETTGKFWIGWAGPSTAAVVPLRVFAGPAAMAAFTAEIQKRALPQ